MAYYTADKSRENVVHIDSNTWTCGDMEMRFHEFRCKSCGKPMIWSYRPYDVCPWCGTPILFFDRRKAASR